jgi:hypothetical protein
MLLILPLLVAVLARVPTTELLFACNDSQRALAWIDGAQDEAIVLTMTLFGGFACDGSLHDGCFEAAGSNLDADLCIADTGRANCEFGGCNLTSISVLVNSTATCCDDAPAAIDTGVLPSTDSDGCVHRSLREWAAIGYELLERAELAYDVGNTSNATSYACAAELILYTVNAQLDSPFFEDSVNGAAYRHEIERQRETTFTAYSFVSRGRRSYRRCPGTCGNHTLIATVVTVDVESSTHPTDGTYQLLWPIAGTLPPFDKSHLPPFSQCVLITAQTNLPSPTAAWRLNDLGPDDYARVAQGFVRCDGLPRNGKVRSVYNLRPNQCCNALTLIDDLEESTRLRPSVNDSTPFSFVYVVHVKSPHTFEAGADPINAQAAFVVRRATTDRTCQDATGTVTAVAALAHADRAKPLTLPPGASQCVGGDDAGKPCTALNECGAGLACRVRPGGNGGAYCFDGIGWNSALPCNARGAQCPYGECYGAVSGDAGGQFPYLHVWQANECDDPLSATQLCTDPRVREWHLHTSQIQ